jgi:hypothetical protein
MIRSLGLFWGFPNQLSSDSWAVGFAEADHAALWIARRPMGADQRSSARARRSVAGDNRLFVDAVEIDRSTDHVHVLGGDLRGIRSTSRCTPKRLTGSCVRVIGVLGPGQSLTAAKRRVRCVRCSGCLPSPSPPAEKTTARQDQAGQSSTDDWPRHCQESPNLAAWERCGVDV